MSYASVADVRAYDASVTAADDEITAALSMAEALVDARARRSFEPQSAASQTVEDVRTDLVVLDLPFTNVTSVAMHWLGSLDWPGLGVSSYQLPITQYSVESWGIRLPERPQVDLRGRGPDVVVEATFASTVPLLIKRAVVLLAIAELTPSTSSSVPDVAGTVKSFAVEGLSVTYRDSAPDVITTGLDSADRLIDSVVGTSSGVV